MAFACFVCSMYTKISFQSPLLGICMYLSGPTKWTNIRSAHTIYVSNFKKFYEYKVGIHIYACTVYTLHTIHPIALLTSSVSFSLFFSISVNLNRTVQLDFENFRVLSPSTDGNCIHFRFSMAVLHLYAWIFELLEKFLCFVVFCSLFSPFFFR